MAHSVKVQSPAVRYTTNYIEADYNYMTTDVEDSNGMLTATPTVMKYTFRTQRKVLYILNTFSCYCKLIYLYTFKHTALQYKVMH